MDYVNGDSVSMYNPQVQFAPPQPQYAEGPFGFGRSVTPQPNAVHHRGAPAREMIFPLRKPCQCWAKVAQHCPPSHSRNPQQTLPVLLPELPAVHLARVSPGPGPESYPVNGSPVPYGAEGARGYSPVSNGHQQAYGSPLQFEGIYTNTFLPL